MLRLWLPLHLCYCRMSLARPKIFRLTGRDVFYVSCKSCLFEINLKMWVVWMSCTNHHD